MQVNNSAEGGAFVFFPWRDYGDFKFSIPGKKFGGLETDPGAYLFTIDGIEYKVLTPKKAVYISPAGGKADDSAILKNYLERSHGKKGDDGAPRTTLVDMGAQQTAPRNGNSRFQFRFFMFKDTKLPDGARIYNMVTVIGDEVFHLAALPETPPQRDTVIKAFENVLASFRFVPDRKACPELMKS